MRSLLQQLVLVCGALLPCGVEAQSLSASSEPISAGAESALDSLHRRAPITELFLAETIRGDFPPQQVFFLVAFDAGEYSRYQALVNRPFEQALERERAGAATLKYGMALGGDGRMGETSAAQATAVAAMRTWRAGVRVPVPEGAKRVSYAVIVAAEGNRFSLMPPREMAVVDPTLYGGSAAALRAELLRQKEELRLGLSTIDANEAELRRLRADADVIADLGRIVEVRDEAARIQQLVVGLKQDQENLAEFVKIAKSSAEPRNYMARERQLTKQNTALADLAKSTESGEFSRKAESERELQRKLAVIEQAKGLDVELLQAEVDALKAEPVGTSDAVGSSVGGPSSNLPSGSAPESPDEYLR